MTRILQFFSQESATDVLESDEYDYSDLDIADRDFLHSFLRDNVEQM